MKYWYLTVLCIVFATILVVIEQRKNYKQALIVKTSASIYFVLLGALSFQSFNDATTAKFIMIGLMFGAIGDIFLNVCHLVDESDLLFFFGGLAFFVGHILYMYCFAPLAGGLLIPSILIGFGIGILISFLLIRKQGAGLILKIETFGYMITVSIMAVMAIAVLIRCVVTPERFFLYIGDLIIPGAEVRDHLFASGLLKGLGGVLFLVSDAALFYRIIHHKEDDWRTSLLVVLTYYPAQCLLATSMQFM